MMWLMRFALSVRALEQSGRTLPAAHAHGDYSITRFAIAPRHFVRQRSHHPRPRHAERVPYRDRTTVHVQLLGIDFQTITAVDHLNGKRFIEFPKIDVAGFHPGTLQ